MFLKSTTLITLPRENLGAISKVHSIKQEKTQKKDEYNISKMMKMVNNNEYNKQRKDEEKEV